MAKVCAHQSNGRSIQVNPTSAGSPDDFESKVIFDTIASVLESEGAEFVKKIGGIFCFKLKKGDKEGVWVIDLKNGTGSVKFDPAGKGEVTVTLDDQNMLLLLSGELKPEQAFFQGKLKLAGNMGLAMKLQQLPQVQMIRNNSKL